MAFGPIVEASRSGGDVARGPKRGAKLSTVANEVLDKALPRWTLERTE
jgi:hypothetical protein